MLFFKVHSAFTPNKITQHTQKTTCNQHGMNPVNQISRSTPLTSEQILSQYWEPVTAPVVPAGQNRSPTDTEFHLRLALHTAAAGPDQIISPEAPTIPCLAATPCDVTYWSPVHLIIN